MGEPLFDLIFKYRQKQLLAVLNVCFGMLKRTKRNETERNALNQPKSLSTTSRHILHYHIATNLELYRFLQCYFIVCVLFKLCDHQRRGRWYRPFVVNVIVWRSRVPSPTTIRYCYANAERESSCHFRIKFILSVRFQCEKCENPLNDVLNGAKMGVSTLFQFITIRQVNLVEHINKIDFV